MSSSPDHYTNQSGDSGQGWGIGSWEDSTCGAGSTQMLAHFMMYQIRSLVSTLPVSCRHPGVLCALLQWNKSPQNLMAKRREKRVWIVSIMDLDRHRGHALFLLHHVWGLRWGSSTNSNLIVIGSRHLKGLCSHTAYWCWLLAGASANSQLWCLSVALASSWPVALCLLQGRQWGLQKQVSVDRQKLYALYDKHIVPWKPGTVIYPILLIASKSWVHPASREGHNSHISMTGVPRSHSGNPCWMGDIIVIIFGK